MDSLQPTLDTIADLDRPFDSSLDFVDLQFQIVNIDFEEGAQIFDVIGEIYGIKVGFILSLSDKTSNVVFSESGDPSIEVTRSGLSLRRSGVISDQFIQCLASLYRQKGDNLKMSQNTTFTSLAMGDNIANLDSEMVNFKIFYDRQFTDQDPEETQEFYENEYFEFYVNFDLPNKIIHLNEKDPEYRRPLIKVLSSQA